MCTVDVGPHLPNDAVSLAQPGVCRGTTLPIYSSLPAQASYQVLSHIPCDYGPGKEQTSKGKAQGSVKMWQAQGQRASRGGGLVFLGGMRSKLGLVTKLRPDYWFRK